MNIHKNCDVFGKGSDTAPLIMMMGLCITHVQMAVALSFHVLGNTDSTLFAVHYCTHTSRQL